MRTLTSKELAEIEANAYRLGALAERERLAKLAEAIVNPMKPSQGKQIAQWIRSQGEE